MRGDHPGAASSAATPPTSISTAPSGRSLTPPTSTTTPTGTTPAIRAKASKKKKVQKIMSRACVALSDFDFSSEDSSISEEKTKYKKGDFTGLCLMTHGGSSQSASDSDVSDDLSFESLSLKVVELENALCNKDKLLCKDFRENKKLNLEMENSFPEIASLRSVHDDMSAKSCDNYKIIMVNYADLWLVHTKVASQLDGAKLELRELKVRSLLLGACTSCPLLKSNLETCVVEIKELKHNLSILLTTMFYPLHAKRVALSRVSFSMLPKRTLS
jgi:hypothetical protein